MNYEQKYKEALERAKNLRKDAIDMGENIRANTDFIVKLEEDEEFMDVILNKHNKYGNY